MKRLQLVAAALGAVTLSCVTPNLGGIIDAAAMGAVKDLAANSGELAAKSRECQRLSTFDVPLNEEVAIGGAVAVKWVSQGGGLALNSNDPEKVRALGPRDQMTLYVDRVGRNLAMQSGRPTIEWTLIGTLDPSASLRES